MCYINKDIEESIGVGYPMKQTGGPPDSYRRVASWEIDVVCVKKLLGSLREKRKEERGKA